MSPAVALDDIDLLEYSKVPRPLNNLLQRPFSFVPVICTEALYEDNPRVVQDLATMGNDGPHILCGTSVVQTVD